MLSVDQDGEEAVSTSPARRAPPSPWTSERSVSKTQPIGRGRRHPSSALSADQDGEEALSYCNTSELAANRVDKDSAHPAVDLRKR